MASSEIIILSDILKRDLFQHETVEGAISELMDLAANINRSSLFFAWTVGKFARDRKLKTQYGIETQSQLAKLMQTSDMSISRYKAVNMLLTEEQLKQLSALRISTSAVLEIANAYSAGYKEESKQLIDLVLSNQIATAAEIKGTFQGMLQEKSKPYNLLPGGEAPAEEAGTLGEDIEAADADSKSPAERLVSEASDVEDEEGDQDGEASQPDSQNKRDAVMMLRTVRQDIAAARRDMTQIWRDLPAEIDKVIEAQGVILGDTESSDTLNELMGELYDDMQRAVVTLIEQLARGAEFGYVPHQLKMPEKGRNAFCGCGLFAQEE